VTDVFWLYAQLPVAQVFLHLTGLTIPLSTVLKALWRHSFNGIYAVLLSEATPIFACILDSESVFLLAQNRHFGRQGIVTVNMGAVR
jgi:hypothetical protein